MDKTILPKAFLIFLIIAIVYACYLIFQPFLVEIFVATFLVSIFYRPYEWLVNKLHKLKGAKYISSLVMCLLVVAIIIVPLINLIIYGAQQSVVAYDQTISYFSQSNVNITVQNRILEKANLLGLDQESVKNFIINFSQKATEFFVNGAAGFLKSTTSIIGSLLLIILIMFFFFAEGKAMLNKLMFWTPLPNKYDKEIFKKFKDVSYSSFIASFLTSIAQGVASGVGFYIVGLPAFFLAILVILASLIPFVGSGIIWLPIALIFLAIGKIWQGIFLLVWGILIISNIDNLIRAFIVKDKAEVPAIFIILSVLGGITMFGFWGVFIGPLIISIAVTILHIYEMEYESILEK